MEITHILSILYWPGALSSLFWLVNEAFSNMKGIFYFFGSTMKVLIKCSVEQCQALQGHNLQALDTQHPRQYITNLDNNMA